MTKNHTVTSAVVAAIIVASCGKVPASETGEAGGDVSVQMAALPKTLTVKEIMAGVIDPSADFLWESTQEISDELGVRKKEPKTDADWTAVRYHLLVLREAPALLVEPGRKAAPLAPRSANPAVENQPEEVQALMEAQHPEWVKRAEALRVVALTGLLAAEAKDVVALNKSLTELDHACESCHVHFWYPNDLRARQVAREDGVAE